MAELAGGRELLEDAVVLYEILERAAGNEIGETPEITQAEGKDDDETETGPDGQPKRRRRRRGGRRR